MDVHSPRMMGDLSFDVIESRYSVRMICIGCIFQALTGISGSGHPLWWRGFPMEMGDLFHWTQAIGRRAFEAPHDPASQHRLLGFHLSGRYQRDLRQRSRKGRLQQTYTTMRAPSFHFGAGLIPASCPIMGLSDSAHGYDCSGNTLHRHATIAVLVTFYSGVQQT